MKFLITFLITLSIIGNSYGQQVHEEGTKEFIIESKNLEEPNLCSIFIVIDEKGIIFRNRRVISEANLILNSKKLLNNCEKNSNLKVFIANSWTNEYYDYYTNLIAKIRDDFLNDKSRLLFSKDLKELKKHEWKPIIKQYSPILEFENCCFQE